MILENTDVRLTDPAERDVAERFPSGGDDLEYLQLTADDGSFLPAEVEPSEADDVWDEEADDFLPPESRFRVRYHDAATGKRYRLPESLPRDEVRRLFFDFLSGGKVKRGRGRWVEDEDRRRGRRAR